MVPFCSIFSVVNSVLSVVLKKADEFEVFVSLNLLSTLRNFEKFDINMLQTFLITFDSCTAVNESSPVVQ